MVQQLSDCIVEDALPHGPRSIAFIGDNRILQWRHFWILGDDFTGQELAALPSRDSLSRLLTRLYGPARSVSAQSTVWERDSIRVVLTSSAQDFWKPEVRVAHAYRCQWLRRFLGGDRSASWARSCS